MVVLKDNANKQQRKQKKWLEIKKMRSFYLMLLIPMLMLFLFSYGPMYGILIAFKDFSPGLGIWQSPWNNFEHFKRLFDDYLFIRALKNTIIISLLKIIISFPAPIIFALLLNEITHDKFKRITQSISYLPHFMSWVILSTMIVEVLSPERGIINFFIG
ncbi:sugar ABC transporter permease, partial [Microvirga sp. 3-52]|nr:sugar ABC transporter permease [Microvirga sp. 3-52]